MRHIALRDAVGRPLANVASNSPGIIMIDERVAPTSATVDPIYIPASVARRQVRQLVERIEAMAREHSDRMSLVEMSCQQVTAQTEAHYVALIQSLRRRANEQSISLRNATVVARVEAERKHAAAVDQITALRGELATQSEDLEAARRVAEDVGLRAALAAQKAASVAPRSPRRASLTAAAAASPRDSASTPAAAAAVPAAAKTVSSTVNNGWMRIKSVARVLNLNRESRRVASEPQLAEDDDVDPYEALAAEAEVHPATLQAAAFSPLQHAHGDVAELKRRIDDLTATIRQQSIDSAQRIEELRAAVATRDERLAEAAAAAPGSTDADAAEASVDEASLRVQEELEELEALVAESRDLLRTTVRSARTLRGYRDPAAQAMKESCDTFVVRAKRILQESQRRKDATKEKEAGGGGSSSNSTPSYAAASKGSTSRSKTRAAAPSGSSKGGVKSSSAKSSSSDLSALRDEIKALKAQLKSGGGGSSSSSSRSSSSRASASSPTAPSSHSANAAVAKAEKVLKKQLKERDVKIRKLEASLERASSSASVASRSGGGNAEMEKKKAERLAKDSEKKAAKAAKEAEKGLEKVQRAAKKKLDAQIAAAAALEDKLSSAVKEATKWKAEAAELGKLTNGLDELRAQAAEVSTLRTEMTAARLEVADVGDKYRAEMLLRKKYYNVIEDMKGKIRVYCRCRPFSGSEKARDDPSCVSFVDEFTLEIAKEKVGNDGVATKVARSFGYDQVFAPSSTQEQVFEDCRRLMQSAIDGYNVCIFAYGQTGSGKTWTMVGKPDFPGLTPRAISELFDLAAENSDVMECTFSSYMVELYNDKFVDLYYRVEHGTGARVDKTAPKLEVKLDAKGMVVIKGVQMRTVSTAAETMELFYQGNGKRHVGSTKMNAESSRSHLVFAVVVEVLNKQTRKVTRGKLSLIDLAGSERVGKTGAAADRLREAKSINMSLSALGNVIRALSTSAKVIPYRSNKLTLLMRDSLGGTAKTLMFVNMSPSAYNTDETISSLVYASQVKMITNSASKSAGESEELASSKKIIAELLASGGTSATLAAKEADAG